MRLELKCSGGPGVTLNMLEDVRVVQRNRTMHTGMSEGSSWRPQGLSPLILLLGNKKKDSG